MLISNKLLNIVNDTKNHKRKIIPSFFSTCTIFLRNCVSSDSVNDDNDLRIFYEPENIDQTNRVPSFVARLRIIMILSVAVEIPTDSFNPSSSCFDGNSLEDGRIPKILQDKSQ